MHLNSTPFVKFKKWSCSLDSDNLRSLCCTRHKHFLANVHNFLFPFILSINIISLPSNYKIHDSSNHEATNLATEVHVIKSTKAVFSGDKRITTSTICKQSTRNEDLRIINVNPNWIITSTIYKQRTRKWRVPMNFSKRNEQVTFRESIRKLNQPLWNIKKLTKISTVNWYFV